MEHLKEMWGRLPKWAKFGVPALLAIVVVYVYIKDKGSSSTTATDSVASGSSDTSTGASTQPADPDTPAVTPTQPVTPTPTVTPNTPPTGNAKAWATLANHWETQADKNASAKGETKPKDLVTVTPSMSKAQAMAAYEHNKTVAASIAEEKPAGHTTVHAAKVSSKTTNATVSHVAKPAKESPRRPTTVTHGLGYIPPKK